jgi:hypothetical protein
MMSGQLCGAAAPPIVKGDFLIKRLRYRFIDLVYNNGHASRDIDGGRFLTQRPCYTGAAL